MGRITILWLLASTVVVGVAFVYGAGILRGGDVLSHLYWGVGALFMTLGANLFAIFHAAQTDRVIRALRAEIDVLQTRQDSHTSID